MLARPPRWAKHVDSTMSLPMIMAGDANVWHPHFNLGRTRSVDALIIPFVDLLASSCGLRLCNPRDQATHLAGAALDLVFISSPCEAVVRVHNGVSCCSEVPSCCTLLGSDHFLCVAATQLTWRPPLEAGPRLPPLRDWPLINRPQRCETTNISCNKKFSHLVKKCIAKISFFLPIHKYL